MKFSKEKKLEIYKRYKSGETIKNLSKEFNIHVQTLYNYFRRNNLKTEEGKGKRSRLYDCNENFFEHINTEEQSYFLGFMLADGYVTVSKNSKRIGLKLQKKDVEIVKQLKNFISRGIKITEYKNSIGFLINSNKLYDSLIKLNCIKNKTYSSINLPEIPKDLYRHLIRGYFDADGSISKRKSRPNLLNVYICSINLSILKDIQKILESEEIYSSIYVEKRQGNIYKLPQGTFSSNCKDMYRLMITSHIDRLKFYEYLYKNCNIKIDRKFLIFNEYYTNTVLTLENKKSKAVQRIEDETLIDYDLIKSFNFKNRKKKENIIPPRVSDNLLTIN